MAACGGTDDFCGGGVSRPDAADTNIGKMFMDRVVAADKRAKQLFDLMMPIMKTAGGQASDILAGGSGAAMIPAIQSAMGQSRGVLSQSIQGQQENMNRMGITGTDYARLTGDMQRQGDQQIAGIPSQFTLPMIQQIMGALTGTPALAMQGSAANVNALGGVTGAQIQPVHGSNVADQVSGAVSSVGNL